MIKIKFYGCKIKNNNNNNSHGQITINLSEMGQFSLWYAYYDSLFLNPCPKLSHNFYMDHILNSINWPHTVCPTLTAIYELLQHFIQSQSNWKISGCQEVELSTIQKDIDDLLHFLELEKSYAYSFWHQDLRRVQASVLHFYTFLQLFVRALIPYPTMTLFQCQTANKLCLKIENLQKLMNQILKHVNQIARFLSNPKFREQEKLIKNFFQNWVFFMKRLPKIKRNKLSHVHKLVKFLSLTNPIQICSDMGKKEQESIRKKSNTVGTKIQLENRQYNRYKSNAKLIEIEQQQPQQQRKRSFSCHTFSFHNFHELNIHLKEERTVLFQFPEEIKKHCKQAEIRNKQISFESLSTLQNKIDTISKIRTLTTNQTRRFTRNHLQISSPNETKRLKAMSYYQRKSPNKSSDKRLSNNNISLKSNSKGKAKFYQEESQRNEQMLSVRSSKQSTIRKRQLSIMTGISKKNQQNQYINESLFDLDLKKMSALTGAREKNSKWDIVRAYVKQRIRRKKIEKILKQ